MTIAQFVFNLSLQILGSQAGERWTLRIYVLHAYMSDRLLQVPPSLRFPPCDVVAGSMFAAPTRLQLRADAQFAGARAPFAA